jgi:1-deoxy-D-xylulose-5-phosphate reductoisomerase
MTFVTVLGSTGSIGTNTLDVIRQNPLQFNVFALAAGRNVELLAHQIKEFLPEVVVVRDPELYPILVETLASIGVPQKSWPELTAGPAALVQIATASKTDVLVSAIVGVTGLEATYEAARNGKRIGLANKETLVSAGRLVMQAVRDHKAELLPIDSEHNGAHQCLRAGRRQEVVKLILTASGGPFRTTPKHLFAGITPAEALRHPTWKMGNRITIDSATLMNKGFEVIEACWLFDLEPGEVEVVVHPQSTVHAMVEYSDGSVLAQVSATDMRMPIQYALTWPDRLAAPVPRIAWTTPRHWDFEPPDFDRFPLLRVAYQAQESGDSATCTLNAADEVAVAAFLDGEIRFPEIAAVVEETLDKFPARPARSIGDILNIDEESRILARRLVEERHWVSSRKAASQKAAPQTTPNQPTVKA